MKGKPIKVDNPFRLGMYQAHRWFPFLFPHLMEDAEQEVRLVNLQYDPNKDIRQWNNAMNRAFYHLARNYGYRKPHMDEIRRRTWYQVTNINMPRTDKGLYMLRGKL